MATPNLSAPVALAWGVYQQQSFMCMQANYAGADSLVTLQPVNWAKPDNLQLWQFGDDGRIYLYTPQNPGQICLDFVNPAQDYQLIQLSVVSPTDKTQIWDWTSDAPAISNASSPTYFIDNKHGSNSAGNPIQLYGGGGSGNSSEVWLPVIIPAGSFANQDASQSANQVAAKKAPARAASR